MLGSVLTDQQEAAAEKNARHMEREFERMCPNVIGNPYIPHFPLPAQSYFLGAHLLHDDPERPTFEALYGGAAGGGKSDALLMAAAQYAWKEPNYHGLLLRRTYTELSQPGALLDRAMKWWLSKGVRYNGTDKLFTFPNGARVKVGYHSGPRDDHQYQGAEYQFVGWDELTHWPDQTAYEWVSLTRVRRGSAHHVPLRVLSASNPGGPGHTWVKEKFIGGRDMVTGAELKPRCLYVPARIQDNPFLDRDAYIKSLSLVHPTVRDRLLDGNWDARDPGDYFRAEWFGPLLDPETDAWPARDKVTIRWWDLAASERADAARTAGVRMARSRYGVRAIEHAVAFRATPGKRDDRIVQTAKADGPAVVQGIELEPGSGGPAQVEALAKRLKAEGIRCVWKRPNDPGRSSMEERIMQRQAVHDDGKARRAAPVASCLERGHQRRAECEDTGAPWWGADVGEGPMHHRDGLRLFAGPWTQGYLDEVEGFPDIDLKDLVDATVGAYEWLEVHGYELRTPPGVRKREQHFDEHTRHPEEFDDVDESGRFLRP